MKAAVVEARGAGDITMRATDQQISSRRGVTTDDQTQISGAHKGTSPAHTRSLAIARASRTAFPTPSLTRHKSCTPSYLGTCLVAPCGPDGAQLALCMTPVTALLLAAALSTLLAAAGQVPPVQPSAPPSGQQAASPVQCNKEAEAAARSRNDAVQRWHAALQVRGTGGDTAWVATPEITRLFAPRQLEQTAHRFEADAQFYVAALERNASEVLPVWRNASAAELAAEVQAWAARRSAAQAEVAVTAPAAAAVIAADCDTAFSLSTRCDVCASFTPPQCAEPPAQTSGALEAGAVPVAAECLLCAAVFPPARRHRAHSVLLSFVHARHAWRVKRIQPALGSYERVRGECGQR